jgi:beta-galactosidase
VSEKQEIRTMNFWTIKYGRNGAEAMEKSMKLDKITLGVCYYPEHWKEELWESDLTRMKEHGIEVVRIAEFAWNKFEPYEGVFTYEFFDRFLELANRAGIKVIFCTPTATPPAWLTDKYPEVLNADVNGTIYRHGLRRHNNYNSPVYREFTARIVDKIASHYGSNPAIIGWQIDNELNCETNVFYSKADHIAFRAYLKEKFRTLDALNDAMGTAFWNQTYTSWEELHLTRPTVNGVNNPHLSLEEKRFISHSAISFCKLQADIIRKYVGDRQFITTNGVFGHLDSHEMTDAALDFITFDSYPNFAYDLDPRVRDSSTYILDDRDWSWNLMKTRSISPVFGIMEQQSGPGGWDARMRQPAPKPGQMRLWSLQSIAHGADYVGYFRWRTCWIGNEIYWHGLNDYSNQPNRRLEELKRVRDDAARLAKLAGAGYKAEIALVRDYANEWDGEQDMWHGPLQQFSEKGWFAAAQKNHAPMDLLYLRNNSLKKTTVEELLKYKILIYPHATILTEDVAALLKAYVEQGGLLVMGSRTGYKDEFGRCPMRPMPGFAGEICGVRVSDYTHVGPTDGAQHAVWDGEELEAPIFNDILEPCGGAEVLAAFKGNYYDGSPALVRNTLGRGKAYYFGAGFSANTAETFLRKLGFANPYGGLLELPAEAEVAVRSKDGADYIFVLNYMPSAIRLNAKQPMIDLLTGKKISGAVELNGYGVMVLDKC